MRWRTWLMLLLIVAGTGPASGCGPASATVSGAVTVDNKPVERGVISFVPAEGQGAPATANIEHGRYEVRTFAGNKHVPLGSKDHSLVLNAEAVAAGAQTDLDELGVAKNAREEKLASRKSKSQMTPDEIRQHMEMERLYRQQVLKEQPTIQIQGLGGGKKKQDLQEVAHKPQV